MGVIVIVAAAVAAVKVGVILTGGDVVSELAFICGLKKTIGV